jgi:ArsR family transcriptional regulator
MELVRIHECLCDRTRLRLLHVLLQGPLCVCHFQEILREPQVKISKHLAYLRARGLVEAEREGNWMVYRLPAKPSAALRANLACLQDCSREEALFRRDLARLKKLAPDLAEHGPCGCGPAGSRGSNVAGVPSPRNDPAG